MSRLLSRLRRVVHSLALRLFSTQSGRGPIGRLKTKIKKIASRKEKIPSAIAHSRTPSLAPTPRDARAKTYATGVVTGVRETIVSPPFAERVRLAFSLPNLRVRQTEWEAYPGVSQGVGTFGALRLTCTENRPAHAAPATLQIVRRVNHRGCIPGHGLSDSAGVGPDENLDASTMSAAAREIRGRA